MEFISWKPRKTGAFMFKAFILSAFLAGIFSCNDSTMKHQAIDIQGHRGARGYLPENTIPAFLLALESGVTTLEMDVVVTSDGKLVVSHEPWMSAETCSHPDGSPVTEGEQESLNLHKMTFAEISGFDCGKRGNARFPLQKPMAAKKPLLEEVINTVEAEVRKRGATPVFYNIETKSEPSGDSIYNPEPEQFAAILLNEINKGGIRERTIVQSFDVRTLVAMRKLDSGVKLALLVESGTLPANLDSLGFKPEIYSPDFNLVTDILVRDAHEMGIKVIPWTVNDTLEMKRLIEMGVDGIITDYPDLGVKMAKGYGKG